MRSYFGAVLASALVLVVVHTAPAQCPSFTTSYLDAYRAIGTPAVGQAQRGSAWEFRRVDADGPLLSGGQLGGIPTPCWITPGAPFFIPCSGPLCSTSPAQDQLPIGRARTINGVFSHPGNNSATDHIVVFRPQGAEILTSLAVVAEDLSTNLSDGVMIDVKVIRAGGTVVLIPPSLIARDATNHSFSPGPGLLPFSLVAGDRVVTTIDMLGNPNEDWINMDIRLGLVGAPVVIASPRDASICTGVNSTFHVDALAATAYQWRRNGVNLTNSPHISGAQSGTLTISNTVGSDAGAYDCLINNTCHAVLSTAANLQICIADIDDGSGSGLCDGGVTIDDLLYFLAIFEEGLLRADVDDGSGTGTPDEGVTIDDLLYFLTRFESGC